MSGDEGILVNEVFYLAAAFRGQHFTLARSSPSQEPKVAQLGQSAGHASPAAITRQQETLL